MQASGGNALQHEGSTEKLSKWRSFMANEEQSEEE